MEVKLHDLVKYCNQYLSVENFDDFCPNGLQVEGKKSVSKIIIGVSACKELFDIAVSKGADLIIVHHGLFWGQLSPLIGILGQRVSKLIKNDVSLVAYHLPLDAHPVIGNNAVMAELLNLQNKLSFLKYNGQEIGVRGEIKNQDFETFLNKVSEKLGPVSAIVKGSDNYVKHIGIVSGGARKDIEQAYLEGIDTYITGEIGEPTKAFCEEAGINYIALGHYNSERWGIQALGNHINETFGLSCEFIEVNNPY